MAAVSRHASLVLHIPLLTSEDLGSAQGLLEQEIGSELSQVIRRESAEEAALRRACQGAVGASPEALLTLAAELGLAPERTGGDPEAALERRTRGGDGR